MKKLIMMLAVAFAAAMPLMAYEWYDESTGYTWTYRINGETAEIYGTTVVYSAYSYTYKPCISPNPTGDVSIPSTLGGKPLTSIGEYAFYNCSELTSVAIHDSVAKIWVLCVQEL